MHTDFSKRKQSKLSGARKNRTLFETIYIYKLATIIFNAPKSPTIFVGRNSDVHKYNTTLCLNVS